MNCAFQGNWNSHVDIHNTTWKYCVFDI